jgi:hypothetical protein
MTGLAAPVNYYTGQQKNILDFYSAGQKSQSLAADKSSGDGTTGQLIGGGAAMAGTIAAAMIVM